MKENILTGAIEISNTMENKKILRYIDNLNKRTLHMCFILCNVHLLNTCLLFRSQVCSMLNIKLR